MIGHISVPDINYALPTVLPMLREHGRRHTAASLANERPTIEWPGVFVSEYTNPRNNVLFDPLRDANPFFHFIEALWLIRGRNDVATLAAVLPKITEYSDNGKTFHGAYGHRLRYGFGLDQIAGATHILSAKPTSRQVVMSIWNPERDLGTKTKDLPCNDMVMLKVRDRKLNITVNNRSNDVVWGCYGANHVQFSMLQMYMAAKMGVGVGVYTQVSDSFHVYEDNPYWVKFLKAYDASTVEEWQHEVTLDEFYCDKKLENPFAPEIQHLDKELDDLLDSITSKTQPMPSAYSTPVAHDGAAMLGALRNHRQGNKANALDWANAMLIPDWRRAVLMWLGRR